MVKDCYEDGICPDCAEPIPDSTVEGEECSNCGHVFWEEYDDFDKVETFGHDTYDYE